MSGRLVVSNNNNNRRDLCQGAIGTSFHARRWLALDPCGCSGICLSWGVHVYALIIIPLCITSHSLISTLLYVTLYVPCSLLALLSLFQAWTTNPGAVPMGARPLTIVRRATSSMSAHSGSSSTGDGTGTGTGTTGTITNVSPAASNAAAAAGGGGGGGRNLQVQNQATRGIRRCHKCNDNYKPPRAHHDSVTGRCIVKFDHFCPWVGNAVGALNHKFFCLFLLYTAICCSISLLLLFIRAVHCGYLVDPDNEKIQNASYRNYHHNTDSSSGGGSGSGNNSNDTTGNSDLGETGGGSHHLRFLQQQPQRALVYKYPECNDFYSSHWVWGLALASLVFLIFTCSMGCEQLDAIETGKGKIARMQMKVGSTGTEFSRVTEEFNEMFGGETGPRVAWHWFFPWRNVTYPRSMKKVVLGYEWDESLQGEPFYYADDNGGGICPIVSVGGDRSAVPTCIDALGDQEMSKLEGGRLKAPPPSSLSSTSHMLPPIASNGSLLSHNGLDNYNLAKAPPPNLPSNSRNNSKDALLMRQDVTAAALDDSSSSLDVGASNSNKKIAPTGGVLAAAASTDSTVVAGTHAGTFGIKNRIAAQKASGSGSVGSSGGGATLVDRTLTRIT